MSLIHDASAPTLCGFVADTVESGAIVHTDGWMGYAPLAGRGYDHRASSAPPSVKATSRR